MGTAEERRVKVRLTVDIPVNPMHGMTEGRIFEVTQIPNGAGKRRNLLCYVMGDSGVEVGLYPHECEVVENEVEE